MTSAMPVPCPTCNKTLRLPDGAAGRKVKCSGCGSVLRIEAVEGAVALSPVHPIAAATTAATTAAPPATEPTPAIAAAGPCPGCGGAVQQGDTFCNHCGVDLQEAAAVAARKAENKAVSQRRRGSRAQASRRNKILSAARYLLFLGILFLIVGTIQGFSARADAQRARANLQQDDPGEELDFQGETVVVRDLLRQIDFEVVLTFGLNYLVGGILLALFFWARKSPFPATLTGLCVYLVMLVINASLDPTTLLHGILWKVLIIGGLVGGMNAALAERAAMRGGGRRAATTGRSHHSVETA